MDSRLPLQVGTSSLWAMARAAATLVPGGLLVAVGVTSWRDPDAEGGTLSVLLGAALLADGLVAVRRAWRTRPSDARITDDALVIEGGIRGGLRIEWAALDPERTRAETRPERRLSARKLTAELGASLLTNELELAPETEVPIRRLHLVAHDGSETVLAEAEHPDEQRSLDALLGSIRAKLSATPASPSELPPQVVGCPGCGAPVPPVDAEAVACRFCGTAAPVPEALRERTRAAAQVREGQREIDGTVSSLLEQPSARWAAASLLGVGLLAALLWAVVAAGLVAAGLSTIGGFELGWGLLAGVLMALFGLVLGRAALASRRALRLLASSFGARAPAHPEGAPGCRRCGGPLPASATIVATCVFCEADNVLGIDVRAQVEPTRQHALSLREVVHARDRERRRWRMIAISTLPVAALAVLMAVTSYVVGVEFREALRDCEQGQPQACYDVSIDYRLGISVAEDDARGLVYGLRACALGHAEACFDLGQVLHYGWDVDEDVEQGETLRLRACALGHAEACSPYSLE